MLNYTCPFVGFIVTFELEVGVVGYLREEVQEMLAEKRFENDRLAF